MKKYGIVTGYNGCWGTIKGVDNIDYSFIKEDLVQKEENLIVNEQVEFEPQIIKKSDFNFYRANYVKIIQKDEK